MRFFPASSNKLHTAATFNLLEEFHLLSFESKVSAYKFYSALSHHSSNSGLDPRKDRYKQFIRMVRQWRHLKMLKRSAHGHDPKGILSTQEGGWNSAPTSKKLFVALDANFRLKHRAVSKDKVDPGLSIGWVYFVEDKAYKAFLSLQKDYVQEKSTCSSHNAVNMADMKSRKGLDATGVGMAVCARHGLKLANGVVDLQFGERYINMDYAFTSAICKTLVQKLNLSYDITYQWRKSLQEQLDKMPPALQLDLTQSDMTYLVPKFHLPAHIAPSPRRWDPVTGMTRLMITLVIGTGKKVIALGPMLLKKISEAVPERNDHQEDFIELDNSLAAKYPEQLSQWKQQVEDWEANATKPNPFEIKNDSITQASIRLQLTKDEATVASREVEPPLHPNVTPSVLIGAGIDLEDQQQRLRVDAAKLGLHATDTQKAKIQQRTNALARRIEAWSQIQALFIPGVAALRDLRTQPANEKLNRPEDFTLFLPSQIKRKVTCTLNLETIKFQLREGQAYNALNELRQALQSRSYMLKFKDHFLRGQGANTRAQNCLKSVDTKINASAAKYRAVYSALCTLGPLLGKVGWNNGLHLLADADIRAMTKGSDDQQGEGRRRLSWIWLLCGYTDGTQDADDAGLQDAICIEWCKARARAHRWEEEVDLLFEEKRRTLQFLRWHGGWWLREAEAVVIGDPLYEGLRVYAQHQAALRLELAQSFEHIWCDTQRFRDIADSVETPSPLLRF
ncbi:hypothetical protein BDN67DRAFT_1017670 [Paxillus ammoniavirescens]|nr:hypothetical protein BDN67DRAFT_1017670 [Paxillus ammoniavirescens]